MLAENSVNIMVVLEQLLQMARNISSRKLLTESERNYYFLIPCKVIFVESHQQSSSGIYMFFDQKQHMWGSLWMCSLF